MRPPRGMPPRRGPRIASCSPVSWRGASYWLPLVFFSRSGFGGGRRGPSSGGTSSGSRPAGHWPRFSAGGCRVLGSFPSVDRHNAAQKLERLRPSPLEGVSADDRPEAAAVADGAGLVHDLLVVVLLGSAREDHDPPAVERRLDHVADALGQRSDR